jgi:DNA replication protein DnaC
MTSHYNKPLLTPYTIENNTRQYDFKKSVYRLQFLGKEKYGDHFKIHVGDLPIIYKLLIYFIRDEENCAEHGVDLNKGILLNGPVGCGKTSLITLMKSFAYSDHNYVVKSTRDIATEFNNHGFATINKYGKSSRTYCFDDIGVENNVKHYGNDCNTIAEVLLHRYDLLVHDGIITHATTNLNADELEKVYGNRVRSRLREMFNLINFYAKTGDKRR